MSCIQLLVLTLKLKQSRRVRVIQELYVHIEKISKTNSKDRLIYSCPKWFTDGLRFVRKFLSKDLADLLSVSLNDL